VAGEEALLEEAGQRRLGGQRGVRLHALAEQPFDHARTQLLYGETARPSDAGTIEQLTPQELQIANGVIEGATNREIAAQLFVSPRTVSHHLRSIF